ncbi:MAG: hypothetical protein HZA27_03315, partial [Candidatus Omnitrophica bacterium]|nr:hypothetical protein [Candidatus Omnitrophota bacterium]
MECVICNELKEDVLALSQGAYNQIFSTLKKINELGRDPLTQEEAAVHICLECA